MGFKSVMKKIGKGALKVAPVAAAFIPGVGPLASALIGAAAGGTDAAVNHKGLKGTLLGAGMGAASGYGADKLSGGKDFTNLFGKSGSSQLLGKTGVDLGSAPTLGSSSSGVMSGMTLGEEGFGGLPMASTGLKGALSSTGKYLAKNPTLMLAAASLLGSDDEGGGQKRHSYRGPLTNPEDSLHQALAATYRAGQGMMEKKPTRLRGLLPDAPQPISIAGLPFQIGGGMGHNPAQDDMDVDSMEGYRNYDPFQSVAPGQFADAKKKTRL